MSFELFSGLTDLIDLTDKALYTAIRSEIDSEQSRDPMTAEMTDGWMTPHEVINVLLSSESCWIKKVTAGNLEKEFVP